jgi:hypothetical protein
MRVVAVVWVWMLPLVAMVLAACPKAQPVPVTTDAAVMADSAPPPPPVWTDAAPTPVSPCQAACAVIGQFCSVGKSSGCAKALTDLTSARAVKNPTTQQFLQCTDAMTPAVVAALKWTCDGGTP